MAIFFKEMNFDRVIKTEDPDSQQMDKSFFEIKNILSKAHKDQNSSTLLYVYYAGHGIIDNTTKIVLNEEDPLFRYFDLEQKLSVLSKYHNTYIVSVLDCCREVLPKEDTRGLGDDDNKAALTDQNYFVTFGCPPLVGVPAKSSIVKSYTQCVKEHLVKTGGVLEIPGALDMKFKAKFEKNSTERRDVTKMLFYDSTRGGKGNVVTDMSTTTPN